MVLLASEYILVISLFYHAFLLQHFSVNETQTTSFKEKQWRNIWLLWVIRT